MDDKEHCWHDFPQLPRLTLLPWLFWALLIVAAIWATKAYAEPRFQVTTGDIRVVLYDDACELKDQITNLPYKAVWHEKGKEFAGCWGPRPEAEVVVGYFADRTVGLIPFAALQRVSGA